MRKYTLLLVSFLTVVFSSCTTMKNTNTTVCLFDAVWELEYISGPKIAFDGLYPDRKPQITFYKATNEVSGTASCNGYGAKYTLEGKAISFGTPNPVTMMFCDGGGEQVFLQMMKKVSSYSIDKEGKLNLMTGEVNVSMMRFKKVVK